MPHREAAVTAPARRPVTAGAALLRRGGRLLRAEPCTLVICALLVCAFYFWTAFSSPPGNGYYSLLADAFEQGNAYLPVQPLPELLALENPYDPAQNAPYRLHDASLYDGRYYLYFGPTPVVLLYLPLRLVGVEVTDQFAAALLCSIGFLLALALARFLIDRYRPSTSLATRACVALLLGLANVAPFLLRRPAVYEVAIAAGYACLMAGLYLTLTGVLRRSTSLARIAGGSLALGLAVGARPHLGLAIPVWLWAWHAAWKRRPAGRGGVAMLAASAALPLLACLALLGAYNLARFGSVTEFGSGYQLAGINTQLLDRFALDRLLPGAFFYLLAPPVVDIVFPFAHLRASFPGSLAPEYAAGIEPVAGALATTPVLVLALAAPVLVARDWRARRESMILASLFLLTALLVLAAPILTFDGATMRYEVDFASLLLLSALLVWLRVADHIGWTAVRIGVRVLVAAGAVAAVLFGLAFSITGYYDGLRTAEPDTYARLEGAFGWIPTLASRLQGHPVLLEARPFAGVPTAETQVHLAAPGAGTAELRATFVSNPALPPGSVVALEVVGSDGVIRRVRLRSGEMTVRAGLAGSGLTDVMIRWVVRRYAGPAPPQPIGAGFGLVGTRVVGWTAR